VPKAGNAGRDGRRSRNRFQVYAADFAAAGKRARQLPAPPVKDAHPAFASTSRFAPTAGLAWFKDYSIKVINELRLDLSNEFGQGEYDKYMARVLRLRGTGGGGQVTLARRLPSCSTVGRRSSAGSPRNGVTAGRGRECGSSRRFRGLEVGLVPCYGSANRRRRTG